MRKLVSSLILSISLIVSGMAASQEWLPDRDSQEGPGVKLGESLVFHPGAMLEGGYDTNPIRESDNAEGAGRLRLSAFLDLATRNKSRKVSDEGVVEKTPPKVDFRFGFAGYYDFFFADSPKVDDQDDFGIDTHLNFVLFPEGSFSLLLNALYLRVVQPYESRADWHARHTLKPGIGFQARPGGGTLMLGLNYAAQLMLFEDDSISEDNNKVTHDVKFETAWKVLPKTSFVSMARFSPIVYTGNSGLNVDSMPVRGLLGLRGLLTPRFGLSLFIGYGASFYDQGDDFESVIANGELMFFITPFANIKLGGSRDFVDSYYANFYVKNGGYLKYEQMFGKIVLLSLKGDVYYRQYSEFSGLYRTSTPSDDFRSDVWAGATLLLEFRVTDWLAFLASALYQSNISDFSFETAGQTDPVEFHRVQALGGVRAYY